MNTNSKSPNWHWIPQIIGALILLQTLYFKFTAAPESVFIFTKIGIEPWGRIGTGVMELIAAILLLVPSLKHWGAALALGIMGGAIMGHLFVLGISVQGDGGALFGLALAVSVCAGILLWATRYRFLSMLPNRK